MSQRSTNNMAFLTNANSSFGTCTRSIEQPISFHHYQISRMVYYEWMSQKYLLFMARSKIFKYNVSKNLLIDCYPIAGWIKKQPGCFFNITIDNRHKKVYLIFGKAIYQYDTRYKVWKKYCVLTENIHSIVHCNSTTDNDGSIHCIASIKTKKISIKQFNNIMVSNAGVITTIKSVMNRNYNPKYEVSGSCSNHDCYYIIKQKIIDKYNIDISKLSILNTSWFKSEQECGGYLYYCFDQLLFFVKVYDIANVIKIDCYDLQVQGEIHTDITIRIFPENTHSYFCPLKNVVKSQDNKLLLTAIAYNHHLTYPNFIKTQIVELVSLIPQEVVQNTKDSKLHLTYSYFYYYGSRFQMNKFNLNHLYIFVPIVISYFPLFL